MPWVSFATASLGFTFAPLLERLLPSLPPTVRDVDVPPLFRERFVLSGYRPVGLSWRCCVLGLFQIHNETLNAWSPLLAAVCMVVRFTMFSVLQGGGILGFQLQGPEGQGLSVDSSSLPLVIYVFSAVTYLSCSAAAHLLHSHSEEARYSLFLLNYISLAFYRYGFALALFLYSSDSTWMQSMLGQIFLPVSALLVWISCTTCCYAQLHLHRPHRKICRVMPTAVLYLLIISPITHRLATYTWNNSTLPLHLLQVVLFLLSAFFFSFPVPECFSPGLHDIVGRSHQLFHIALSLCTLVQQEALFEDFLWRRPALVREFGEQRLLLFCASIPSLMLCCLMTALTVRWRAQKMKIEDMPAFT